jgi:hypothetical protein
MANPALSDLSVLVGSWDVELTNAEWLDPGASLRGRLEVSWLDESFLVLRSAMDGEEVPVPVSVSVVGRSEDRDDYTVLYADDRGVSRVYAMTFRDGSWTQTREDPGFHQRFEGRVDGEQRVIEASWSRSHDDGATWLHDFDLVYRRQPGADTAGAGSEEPAPA